MIKTAYDLMLERIAESYKGKVFEDDTIPYSFVRVQEGSFVFKSGETVSSKGTEKHYTLNQLVNLVLQE